MSLSDPPNVLYLVMTFATVVPALWAGTYLGKSYRQAKARFTLVLGIALAALLAHEIAEIATLVTHQSYTPTTGDLGRNGVDLIVGWALFYVISR
jgi:hypothetical protein